MPNPILSVIQRQPGAVPIDVSYPSFSVTLDGRFPDGPYHSGYLAFEQPTWILRASAPDTCELITADQAWQLHGAWNTIAQQLHEASPCWIAGYLSYAHADQQILGADGRPPESLPGALLGGFRHPHEGPAGHGPACGGSAPFTLATGFRPFWSHDAYRLAFERIIEYIRAGDVYQINLTQCLEAVYQGDPLQAFESLVARFRAPFSGYVRHAQHAVLSFSPERFIQIRGRNIETRPIKGTRPRGATADDDRAQADALVRSEKDRAENLMIVDLLRNDLGRFCQPGSIRVPELFGLEHYSNVHHLVSTITGTLRDGVFPLDVLAGCSPGGSITGAPKRRAMEIIRELEPVQRGVYCGSLFYMTPEGNLDSSIAIRTLTADGQRLRVWGGGGIVADSDCDAEYEESLTKIRHLIQALEQYRTP